MDDRGQSNVLSMKGTEAYTAWIREVRDRTGMSLSTLVRRALAAYAQTLGVSAPPKR